MNTRDQASQAARRAKTEASAAADDFQDSLGHARAAGQAAADNLSARAYQAVEEGSNAASRLQSQVHEAADEAGERLSTYAHDARNNLNDVRQRAAKVGDQVQRQARSAADQGLAAISQAVRDNPVGAVAAAFGIGLFLGMFSRR